MNTKINLITSKLDDMEVEKIVNEIFTEASELEPVEQARVIKKLIDKLDDEVDETLRKNILFKRGHGCYTKYASSVVNGIIESASDIDDLLKRLNDADMGGGKLKKEGNIIHASYGGCPCFAVNKAEEKLSLTYCNCSSGWFKALFESFLKKDINVDIIQSIASGADECKFNIYI